MGLLMFSTVRCNPATEEIALEVENWRYPFPDSLWPDLACRCPGASNDRSIRSVPRESGSPYRAIERETRLVPGCRRTGARETRGGDGTPASRRSPHRKAGRSSFPDLRRIDPRLGRHSFHSKNHHCAGALADTGLRSLKPQLLARCGAIRSRVAPRRRLSGLHAIEEA